ncbi:hypothetical protein NS115_03905 [Paenibacillus jamilae]|uniref:Uncharacterized protein n=1 Tax=Paenibacillus jamilae TaxID=114136 RepID=A0ACC5A0L6_9BACL|nr:hypothetical protein [Paenibacillus jamilae]KTS84480.1 hypothetical protein NS115_03905 [Paenibacillus jamilae]
MGILTELDSVASVVLEAFPESEMKYKVPKEPKTGQFVLRSQKNDLSTESRFTFRIERLYQLIYYSDNPAEALDIMDRLSRQLMRGTTLIPINDGSFRYIRIESFSFSDPVETESGLSAVIASMPTEIRQARDQKTFEKIMQVHARIN